MIVQHPTAQDFIPFISRLQGWRRHDRRNETLTHGPHVLTGREALKVSRAPPAGHLQPDGAADAAGPTQDFKELNTSPSRSIASDNPPPRRVGSRP